MPEIISRIDAAHAGLKHYYTGKPCKYGHVAKRYVSTCKCVECNKESFRNWYDSDRDRAIRLITDSRRRRAEED